MNSIGWPLNPGLLSLVLVKAVAKRISNGFNDFNEKRLTSHVNTTQKKNNNKKKCMIGQKFCQYKKGVGKWVNFVKGLSEQREDLVAMELLHIL